MCLTRMLTTIHPIRLERAGPSEDRNLRLMTLLENTEMLRGLPRDLIRMFRRGNLQVVAQGEKIWDSADGEQKPGICLVVWGMVRCVVEAEKEEAEFYLGSGGVIGLVSSLIGQYVPGIMPKAAYAEGNQIARGPVILRIPW